MCLVYLVRACSFLVACHRWIWILRIPGIGVKCSVWGRIWLAIPRNVPMAIKLMPVHGDSGEQRRLKQQLGQGNELWAGMDRALHFPLCFLNCNFCPQLWARTEPTLLLQACPRPWQEGYLPYFSQKFSSMLLLLQCKLGGRMRQFWHKVLQDGNIGVFPLQCSICRKVDTWNICFPMTAPPFYIRAGSR